MIALELSEKIFKVIYNHYMRITKMNWNPPTKIEEMEILRARVGSHSYGTAMPTSDVDYMSVYLGGDEVYLGMDWWGEQGTKVNRENAPDGEIVWEQTSYELSKFLRLCQNFNPNVIPVLWLREADYYHLTDAGRLLIENREIFNSKMAVHSFCGYAFNQLSKMNTATGRMGAKRKALRDQFGFDCYLDEETHFLTRRGWLKFDEIVPEDQIATVGVSDGVLEWQHYLNRYDKQYSGPLVLFNGRGFRARVTINHHMLVSPCHRNPKTDYSHRYFPSLADWALVPISTLITSDRSRFHYRRTVVPSAIRTIRDLTWLTLAGMFLSDGTCAFHENGTFKCIRFTQSYDNTFSQYLDRLILEQFVKMNCYCYGQQRIWDWYGPGAHQVYEAFGHSTDKHLPTWCFDLSAEEIDALWNGCMWGDGSVYNRENRNHPFEVLYSANSQLASDIHAMLTCGGYSASLNGPYHSETTHGPVDMWQVRLSSLQDPIGAINTRHLDIEDVKDRRVVCFEMPNGTLVTRNQGKVSIHGNTKYAFHAVRLARMVLEFVKCDGEDMKVWRVGIDADELLAIRNGAWSFEQVTGEVEAILTESRELVEKSCLPEHPDKERIRDLCRYMVRNHLRL